jgi:uncharacterized membrane protein HdeD (DUF308 family)
MQGQIVLEGLSGLGRKWGWFLVLGIVLIVLGTVALSAPWVATLASVVVLGWLILAGGIVETVSSFWAMNWNGFLMHLLSGVLSIVVGVLIVGHPLGSAAGLTLLLAVMFLTGGVFRVVAAACYRYPSWGWTVVDGLAMVVLGVMIWSEWPSSSLWVIGMFIGINLLFRGFAWVMFALGVRKLNKTLAS